MDIPARAQGESVEAPFIATEYSVWCVLFPTHLHMDSDTQRGGRRAPFDEESMFALLVKAIKRFLARLCQAFAPISSSPVRSSDPSGPMSVNMSAASVLSGAQDEREETPAPTLASVRHSACERVERAADNSLRHSLEAALALPPLECRHALRALLQQNFSDS